SARGGYMIVRQSDAHAWTELWLEGQGWTRVDPTAALVPERVTLDLRTLLAGGQEELQRQRSSLLWQTLSSTRLWWDSIEYDWYNSVISFDEEAQIAWMNWLGLGRLRGRWLILLSAMTLALALLGLLLWLRRPAPARDRWLRSWQKTCRRLEKQGAPPRLPSEGPLHYAQKVATACPHLAETAQALANTYANGRYGRPGGSKK
ncbi:MAG: transglutaminase domain-containing protein, partial [Prosthecobacter sp.]|nr:transglutaminase domain-containing protein [Prosthecobacter sp.]